LLSFTAAPCPPAGRNWRSYAGTQYFMSSTTANWNTSRATCKRLGMDLAIVDSLKVHRYLTRLAQSKGVTDFWVGGTDMFQESNWIWVDGSRIGLNSTWRTGLPNRGFAMWGPDQPNNKDGNENCLHMRKSSSQGYAYTWNDHPCSLAWNFVCALEGERLG
jgi:hypothetical protein